MKYEVYTLKFNTEPTNSADAKSRAADLAVVEDASRPRQSPRIAIRRTLGAPRLTTSGCSRLRAQAGELAHVLATDPRRLG